MKGPEARIVEERAYGVVEQGATIVGHLVEASQLAGEQVGKD